MKKGNYSHKMGGLQIKNIGFITDKLRLSVYLPIN